MVYIHTCLSIIIILNAVLGLQEMREVSNDIKNKKFIETRAVGQCDQETELGAQCEASEGDLRRGEKAARCVVLPGPQWKRGETCLGGRQPSLALRIPID